MPQKPFDHVFIDQVTNWKKKYIASKTSNFVKYLVKYFSFQFTSLKNWFTSLIMIRPKNYN